MFRTFVTESEGELPFHSCSACVAAQHDGGVLQCSNPLVSRCLSLPQRPLGEADVMIEARLSG